MPGETVEEEGESERRRYMRVRAQRWSEKAEEKVEKEKEKK